VASFVTVCLFCRKRLGCDAKPIAYKLSFTNRKRKYFEEKTTATLKIKQASIATPKLILTSSLLPDLPPFSLPTTFKRFRQISTDVENNCVMAV
jgi:hypothetical protein